MSSTTPTDTTLSSGDVSDKDARQRRRRSPIRFIKNVYAELRKVVWPTRKEVTKYSIVVLFCLILMIVIITVLDSVFSDAAFFLFK